MEKEIRSVTGSVEVRSETEGEKTFPIIEGYALMFDTETFIGGRGWGWYEKIDRSALTGCDMSDVVAKFNHDPNYPLARTGSVNDLSLIIDERGLKYSFKAMNEDGEKCAENIRLGIVRGSSFEFSGSSSTWVENYKEQDGYKYELRTINKINRLHDVAPVLNPAYAETNAVVRSESKFKETKEEKRTQPSLLELKLKSLKIK
jgi:HK97 family phage prohead protease